MLFVLKNAIRNEKKIQRKKPEISYKIAHKKGIGT